MIPVQLRYASASGVTSDRRNARLGLSADAGRPVRFTARVVKHVLSLRLGLQTLANVLWADTAWSRAPDPSWPDAPADPFVTVHPDRLFFEVFSRDQSVYARLIVDRSLFEPEDEVCAGTTHVDFGTWLGSALHELRSSRATWLSIGAPAGGTALERTLTLPPGWVRGLVQLQQAMTLPGTRIVCRPVDLLAALRFLGFSRSRVSPRALRYEFEPGQPVRLVLEPWEQVFVLKQSEHYHTERRVVRTWGRHRLRLLEPLLPYAEHVDVHLRGRAMPSFYAVRLPGVTFLLGLSGWADQGWSATSELLSDPKPEEFTLLGSALSLLREAVALKLDDLAGALNVAPAQAARLLLRLARQGKLLYDLEQWTYRVRELFAEPLDEGLLFPPEPRQEEARRLLREGLVEVRECRPRETRKVRRIRTADAEVIEREVAYRDWEATGTAGDQAVSLVLGASGRLLFGHCGCRFFRENTLTRGPCEHLLALREAVEPQS